MALTVWIIDDDPDVAEHLEAVFDRAGYEVELLAYESAAATFEAIDKAPAPDMVFVDQVLPDKRGSEMLMPIHAVHPGAVIRLIAAAPDELDAVDRAIGVVEKPPSVDVLKALIELRAR